MYQTAVEALLDKISGLLLRGLSKFGQFEVRFIHAQGNIPDVVVVSVVRSKMFSFFWLTQELSLSFKVPVFRIYPMGMGKALGLHWFEGRNKLTTEEAAAINITIANIERRLKTSFSQL